MNGIEPFDPAKEKSPNDCELGELFLYVVVKKGGQWPVFKADNIASLIEFCKETPNCLILTKVVAIGMATWEKEFWERTFELFDPWAEYDEIDEFIRTSAIIGP